eukprot:TRINITY_DN8137_c2_g1_i2.p2 TRINITY_DN8137_c2_g1~~TRINITY_DN8137_c2_g1_i2.p2  ORF type:complete len:102 (+),score=10.64 TRINITY_DN8137_c2_g1_i2:33-338(+)
MTFLFLFLFLICSEEQLDLFLDGTHTLKRNGGDKIAAAAVSETSFLVCVFSIYCFLFLPFILLSPPISRDNQVARIPPPKTQQQRVTTHPSADYFFYTQKI